MKTKTHKTITHPLPNPVFNGLAVETIKSEIVATRMERDPWYAFNAGQLLLNHRLGRVADTVFKNVMVRLNHIALQRANQF